MRLALDRTEPQHVLRYSGLVSKDIYEVLLYTKCYYIRSIYIYYEVCTSKYMVVTIGRGKNK